MQRSKSSIAVREQTLRGTNSTPNIFMANKSAGKTSYPNDKARGSGGHYQEHKRRKSQFGLRSAMGFASGHINDDPFATPFEQHHGFNFAH